MIEIDVPYHETHLNVALSLYTQRINCAEQRYVHTSVQESIEKRLLIHLYVLARTIDEEEQNPKDDAELFIYISRRLVSPNDIHKKEIILFSKQLFIEFINPKGLIDAFILFYNEEINKLLIELFDSHKELRATIIAIWHCHGHEIPIGLLNQSELQLQDSELQKTVLSYQADQENIGVELFRNYYRSFVENVENISLDSNVLVVSLWGGMLRQDVNIEKAIRRAIELESNEKNREKYLRLAALIGGNEILPVFNSVCEIKPEFGSYLISLLGTTESVKMLFSLLQQPQISLQIIPAWQQLTGQKLNVVPRIALVKNDKEKSNVDESEDIPLIADVEAAQKWAKKNIPQWKNEIRYIHGNESSITNLIELSYLLSGKIGKDIIDLLSLQVKEKTNFKLNSWITDRYKLLDEISENTAISTG